jgi:hypothetical protein
MGISKRYWAFFAASAAAISAAPGCNDNDQTEVCVGPDCPQYDGVGGDRNFFRSSDPPADEAGSAGASGDISEGTDAGSGEVPPPEDGGPADGSTPSPPACQLAFVTPVGGDAGALTLDGSNDTDNEQCGSEFTIGVALTSNAASVTLFVNDAPLPTQDLVDGAVSFTAVLGNRGASANVLRAEARMADNSTCSLTFPSDVFVDCPGPSCSIVSPVASGAGYLNNTQDIDGASGFQADVVVHTEVAHVGQPVRLELDGAFDEVPDAVVIDDAGTGSAPFGNVTLTEGPHTVRAQCSDAFGVTVLSTPATWNVDTTPCTISISSIAANANPITPSNDLNPGTPGIQVLAGGQITGGDCKTLWIGVCGGALTGVPLSLPPDGSFSLPVTLTGSTGTLDVCGSVEDQAGNVSGQDQISVNLRLDAPQVAIASPSPSTRYNLAGTAGALADGNALSATCEAAVVVNCTEVGQNVALLADGSEIAQASCVAQGGLPSPFLGRATFAAVSLTSKNDGSSTTLTAQQAASGFSASTSAPVSVQADCEAPSCNLVSPSSSLSFLNAALDSNAASGLQINFDVGSDANSIGQTVTLNIDGGTNGSLNGTLLAQGGGSGVTFADVPLPEGTRTAQAQCVDAAGNVQMSTSRSWIVDSVACSASAIVVAGGASPITPAADSDGAAPGLQVGANGQATGGGCSAVRVGPCGSLSGAFSALAADESFSALPLTLGSSTGSANVCVEIQDDAGNVGQAQISVAVRVDPPVVTITSPNDGDTFNVASTCDTTVDVTCTDVGVPVLLLVDGVLSDSQVCQLGNTASFSLTLPTKNNGALTSLAAQQTANGLTSTLASIGVRADCQNPAPTITAPICGGQLAIPEDDLNLVSAGLQADVEVANDGVSVVDLTITRGATSSSAQADGGLGATTTTFSALDLGAAGSIDLVACVTDSAGNQGCSAGCTLTIAGHPSLAITSPATLAMLSSATTDCNGGAAGLDVTVQGTTNATVGSAVQNQIGSGTVANTTVSGGSYTTCVAAPEGLNQTLTVTVTDGTTGLATSTSIQVGVDSLAPTAPILAPTFLVTGRRQGTVQLTWNAVNDTDGSTLSSYLLRCAATDITNEITWGTATSIPVTTVPSSAGGPAHSEVFSSFRTGTTRFCVIRGVDRVGQLTPIAAGQSVTVTNPFLTNQYSAVPTATSFRASMAPIGDVNGDGQKDFIVGSENATNTAQVYFGGAALDTSPDIVLNGPSGSRFGTVVAALGDINGDGRSDFAVAAPIIANGANTVAGSVYVFFGRATGDTWPSPINVSAAPGCGADICFHGTLGATQLGLSMTATDFNGDGSLDVVIGAQAHNNRTGRVYVILGGSQLSVPSGTIFNLPDSNPNGFVLDPPGTDRFFGVSVTPIGSGVDGFGDLVIGAPGRSASSTPGAVFFMAGEAYPAASSGLIAPSASALTQFDSGAAGDFGFPVASLGDFDGDGFNDVCVGRSYGVGGTGGACNVYRGGASGFAGPSALLTYINNLADNDWSTYVATARHEQFGLIGDLDNDGHGDLAIGSTFVTATPNRVGTVELFYGDVGVGSRNRSVADAHFQSGDQGNLAVNYVGDINGDGFNDVALFDSDAGTASRLTLLY